MLSEWCLVLVVMCAFSVLTPVYQEYTDKIIWQGFEHQIRVMQHRALMRLRYDTSRRYLYLTDRFIQLDDGLRVSLPAGWRIETPGRIEISRVHPQAGKIQLINQKHRKEVVFQLGGGTFDIQS